MVLVIEVGKKFVSLYPATSAPPDAPSAEQSVRLGALSCDKRWCGCGVCKKLWRRRVGLGPLSKGSSRFYASLLTYTKIPMPRAHLNALLREVQSAPEALEF